MSLIIWINEDNFFLMLRHCLNEIVITVIASGKRDFKKKKKQENTYKDNHYDKTLLMIRKMIASRVIFSFHKKVFG